MKKWLSLALAAILITTAAVPALSVSAAEEEEPIALKEGAYVPNQVVVLFRDGTIDADTLPDNDDLAAVGADFGDMMDASSS